MLSASLVEIGRHANGFDLYRVLASNTAQEFQAGDVLFVDPLDTVPAKDRPFLVSGPAGYQMQWPEGDESFSADTTVIGRIVTSERPIRVSID